MGEYLAEGEAEGEVAALRESTHTGRPLGTAEFVHSLEQAMQRRLARQKGGRRSHPSDGGIQNSLAFAE